MIYQVYASAPVAVMVVGRNGLRWRTWLLHLSGCRVSVYVREDGDWVRSDELSDTEGSSH